MKDIYKGESKMNNSIELYKKISEDGQLSDQELTLYTARLKMIYLNEKGLQQQDNCDYQRFFGFELQELPFVFVDHFQLFYQGDEPVEFHMSPYPSSLRKGSIDALKEWLKRRGFEMELTPYSFYRHGRTVGIRITKSVLSFVPPTTLPGC